MTLIVEPFGGTADEWDAFVQGTPGGTHCHLAGWRSVIETELGHDCTYLVARAAPGGPVVGILPLVHVASRLFGSYLVSMPFLNSGGPLGTPEAIQALVARGVALARESRVDLLELRSRTPLDLDLPVSHRKIGVVRDLVPGDPAAVWQSLAAKVRSQVRRPSKAGMVVRFGLDQVEPFSRVFAQRMRDLGTPALPRRFFERVAETFPQDLWVGCAYYEGRVVAAGYGFRWGHEVEMTWAATVTRYNALAPNMLLYWAFMERAAALGVSLFNFGRCTPESGTHRFKRQWGSRDVPLCWYQRRAGRRVATPSPDERAFAWGPRLWRRLPLPIANALGARVVRLIP